MTKLKAGRRILREVPQSVPDIEEIEIIELSPDGEWVKFKSKHGYEYWRRREDIKVIAILSDKSKSNVESSEGK